MAFQSTAVATNAPAISTKLRIDFPKFDSIHAFSFCVSAVKTLDAPEARNLVRYDPAFLGLPRFLPVGAAAASTFAFRPRVFTR